MDRDDHTASHASTLIENLDHAPITQSARSAPVPRKQKTTTSQRRAPMPAGTKTFVLDTNVLLHDPACINRFAEHHLCIPVDVLSELDRFKNEMTERGANAREVHRALMKIFSAPDASVMEGVKTAGGGMIRIVTYDPDAARNIPSVCAFERIFPGIEKTDHRILACVLQLCEQIQPPVILVSKDLNMQLKARAVGIVCEDYLHDKVEPREVSNFDIARIDALDARQVSRIILTRPAVEAGERLGFLPGDLMAKVDPYLRPLFDALYDMMDGEQVTAHLERGVVEVAPLAFMRGRTLNDAFIILDEAQNTTKEQMRMFLTRLGMGSKVVVTGDPTQVDLPRDSLSGLVEAARILQNVPDIGIIHFDRNDVVRHKLVQRIVEAYRISDEDTLQ